MHPGRAPGATLLPGASSFWRNPFAVKIIRRDHAASLPDDSAHRDALRQPVARNVAINSCSRNTYTLRKFSH